MTAMLHKESWVREAQQSSSLDQQLRSLLRRLNDGSISPVEYAKIVLRLHGYGDHKGLLSQIGSHFIVTPEWREVHKNEVEAIENLAMDLRDEVNRAGRVDPYPREDAPEDNFDEYTDDVLGNLSNIARLYQVGNKARKYLDQEDPESLWGVLSGAFMYVKSEEELNASLQPTLESLTKFRQHVQGLSRQVRAPSR